MNIVAIAIYLTDLSCTGKSISYSGKLMHNQQLGHACMECSYIASAWPAKSNNFVSEVLPCVDGYGGVLIAEV